VYRSRSHNLVICVLSRDLFCISNTTGVNNGGGTAYPSRAPDLTGISSEVSPV
jgi:hypothetical protein